MRFFSVATAATLGVAAMSLLASALPTYHDDAGIKPSAEEDSAFACHSAMEHAPAAPANKQWEAETGASEGHSETATPEAAEPKPEEADEAAAAPEDSAGAYPSAPAEVGWRGDGYLGQSVVYNNCPFVVHSNIVHGPRPGVEGPPEEIYSILQPQEGLSHPFAHDPRMGVSWKLWRTDSDNTAPVQFEWTWHDSFQRTWYDLSMVNAGDAGWLDEDAHQAKPSSATRTAWAPTSARSPSSTPSRTRA
ncbi:hypothetical protein CLAIMM_02552 [Cladophialophora immunda]|nr:hypothetical protein CLAIMM_02552 [Cladophialophora immunda]